MTTPKNVHVTRILCMALLMLALTAPAVAVAATPCCSASLCLRDQDTCQSNTLQQIPYRHARRRPRYDPDDPHYIAVNQQMQMLLQFVEQAIQEERLIGYGPGRSAPRRLRAFNNRLRVPTRHLAAGRFRNAAKRLERLLRFADGQQRPKDFVAGTAIAELAQRIQNLIDAINNPLMPEYSLNIIIEGQGAVVVDPNLDLYTSGQTVQLTAIAEPNWTFVGFSGDLETLDNPAPLIINADTSLTATFEPLDAEAVIEIWYGDYQNVGQIGIAQPWANILGNILGAENVASLAYSLNGGPDMHLSIGPDENDRLAQPGDFNAEVPFDDLDPGLNNVTLTATYGNGETVSRTVTLDYDHGNTWPLPYVLDWTQLTHIHQGVQVIDGLWGLLAGAAKTVVTGFDRNIILGDLNWQDYEITADVRVDSIDIYPGQPGGKPAVGILLRWQGHIAWNPDDQPRIGWYPCGALGWFKWAATADAGSFQILGSNGLLETVDNSGLVPEIGVMYVWKMRVETMPDLSSLYSLKVWPAADPEPVEWLLTYQNDPDDPPSGSIMLLAHHANVAFGNLTVTPLEAAPE